MDNSNGIGPKAIEEIQKYIKEFPEYEQQLNTTIKMNLNSYHDILRYYQKKNDDVLLKDLQKQPSEFAVGSYGILLIEAIKRNLINVNNSQRISNFNKNADSEKQSDIAITKITNTKAIYQFNTLLGYGKFISGLGWLVIAIGIIAIIGGFASGSEVGVGISVGSLIFIILGIGMVASGQLISCFVSIEKNTRATYELLKQGQK